MKTNSIIFLLLIVSFLKAQSVSSSFKETNQKSLHHSLVKNDALNVFLSKLNDYKIIQTEILASYYFHQKINEYRKEQKLKELDWSNRLWISARNHSIYLAFSKYDHIENKTLEYFTGAKPADRIHYVDPGIQLPGLTGENILMNYAAYFRHSIVDNAKNIAEASFEQWKASPEHNENMLYAGYTTEGTAFYIMEGSSQVFATTNFSNEFEKRYVKAAWDYLSNILLINQQNGDTRKAKEE